MPNIRELWVTLRTADFPNGGTDANFFLEFGQSGKSFRLPDQPGNDLERAGSTSYVFNVDNLTTEEFVDGTVTLRNDNSGVFPGWRCEAILIIAIGEDGRYYPMVAMENVDRWLAADEPEGLVMTLDILHAAEVGLPAA